jgi:hypothetical protein
MATVPNYTNNNASTDSNNSSEKEIDYDAALRRFGVSIGSFALVFGCLGLTAWLKRKLCADAFTNDPGTENNPDRPYNSGLNIRWLKNPDAWNTLPAVSSDAPPADDTCPICLADIAEVTHPVRIRQPDGQFIEKIYDYDCLVADMRYRAENRKSIRDPSNQQPYTEKDIHRQIGSRFSLEIPMGSAESAEGLDR